MNIYVLTFAGRIICAFENYQEGLNYLNSLNKKNENLSEFYELIMADLYLKGLGVIG